MPQYALIIIGALVLLVLSRPRPRGRQGAKKMPKRRHSSSSIDRGMVAGKLGEIDMLMGVGRPSNFKVAVVECDKLLSHILRAKGYEGALGEQLKAARSEFTDYNGIWEAHKVRNAMVHEVTHETFGRDARSAVAKFKQAFKDLGAM